MVLVKTGGAARAISATKTGQGLRTLTPNSTSTITVSTRIPNEGIALPMLTTAPAMSAPRRRWPSHNARGRTRITATTVATTEIQMCSQSRAGIEPGPDQVSGSLRNSTA